MENAREPRYRRARHCDRGDSRFRTLDWNDGWIRARSRHGTTSRGRVSSSGVSRQPDGSDRCTLGDIRRIGPHRKQPVDPSCTRRQRSRTEGLRTPGLRGHGPDGPVEPRFQQERTRNGQAALTFDAHALEDVRDAGPTHVAFDVLYRPFFGLNVRSGSVGSFPIPLERGLDRLCDPFRCHH